MAISHVFTNPIPDGTNTNIVRPSDWNSAHNQYYTLSGNTLGVSTVSGTNVVLQAGSNISLSGTGQTIVIQGTSTPQPTSYVSNVNGLSGAVSLAIGSSLSSSVNGSSITFGLASNITTALQSANSNYLTTQTVQTQASGNIAGSGFTGVNATGTLNSNGLSLSVAPSGAAAMYANLSGNTTGNTTASGSTINLSGINITLSGTNGSQIAISAPAASALSNGNNITISNTGTNVGISAQAVAVGAGSQTATSGTVNFVNSNGVTFGMSGSNQITASVAAAAGMYANLSGATSGNTTASGNTLNFSGINVTLSGTNASQIAISAPATSSLSAGNNISLSSNGSTIGLSALAVGLNTAQTNVTWTVNSSGISLNAAGYAGTGTSATNASVTLNSAGLAISVAPPGAANYSIGVSNLGNTAGSTGITGTRIVFVGTNNISLSQSTDASGATISINQTGGGGGGIAAAAGTQTATSGTVNFANSNGITFGMSGSNQITASYTVPTVPTSYVSNVNGSSGQISLNVGSSLSSSTAGSSITFGLASNITTALQSANANYLTSQSNQAFSASGGSSTFQTLNFANTNGVTFSNSNGSVQVTHDLQYTSNTSAITSNALNTSASRVINIVAATNNTGGGTASLSSNVSFTNANGLTFYTSAGGALAASYTVPTQSVQTQASGAIAGTGFTSTTTAGTAVVGTLSTNGLSLGVPAYLTAAVGGAGNFNLSGATSGNTTASGNTINLSGINITLSGTNNSQIAISAPATSSLSGGNNISISSNGSTIGLSAQAAALGAGTQTATSGTVAFVNSNGVTFGMSGSNQITASYTQSNQAFSASGGSSTFQTLNFANSNGVTFSNTGGSVVASYTVPATTGFAGTGFTSTTTAGTAVQGTLDTNGLNLAVPAYLTAASGAGNAIGVTGGVNSGTGATGTIYFATGNNFTFGFDAASSHITASWGLGVYDSVTNQVIRRLSFANSNGISFGLITGTGVTATLTADHDGLTNINVSAGTTSNNLSNIVFSNSNGVSFGLSGSTVTASVAPAGGGYTASGYNHYNDVVQALTTHGNGTVVIDHLDLDANIQFDRFGLLIGNSNATNSSGSHTVSFWLGVYTQNGSSISRLFSTSSSLAATMSGTVGSYSLYSGVRQFTIPFTTTITAGEYFLAVLSRTSSAGANGSYSQVAQSNIASNYNGLWGASAAATGQQFGGMGYYSTTTTAMPQSIAFSEIQGTNSNALRPPVVIFHSGTY